MEFFNKYGPVCRVPTAVVTVVVVAVLKEVLPILIKIKCFHLVGFFEQTTNNSRILGAHQLFGRYCIGRVGRARDWNKTIVEAAGTTTNAATF